MLDARSIKKILYKDGIQVGRKKIYKITKNNEIVYNKQEIQTNKKEPYKLKKKKKDSCGL